MHIFNFININDINKIIILLDPNQKEEIVKLIPFSEFYFSSETKEPMVYVCKDYTCDLPTNDLNKIREQLED